MNQECPPFVTLFVPLVNIERLLIVPLCHGPTLTPLTQVSVVYETNEPRFVSDVVVSTQHTKEVDRRQIEQYVIESLAPRALGNWFNPEIRFLVNPTGSFVQGGPSADCGVTAATNLQKHNKLRALWPHRSAMGGLNKMIEADYNKA